MASAQVVETSVSTNNSPSQEYTTNPDDHSNHNIYVFTEADIKRHYTASLTDKLIVILFQASFMDITPEKESLYAYPTPEPENITVLSDTIPDILPTSSTRNVNGLVSLLQQQNNFPRIILKLFYNCIFLYRVLKS